METISKFKDGHWTWSETLRGVKFISHEPIRASRSAVVTVKRKVGGQQPILPSSIHFKENVDTVEKIFFRRNFQRYVRLNEPDYITVQDIKDVALYLANPKDLTVEFINYFHLPEIDDFLKNAIVYFHYYLQIWQFMSVRREEARRKLRQPAVTELEDIVSADLSDLRSMLAREYSVLLLGIGQTHPYHHFTASMNSLSERDRRIFEAFACMSAKVIWIALQRKFFPIIELELNRILRTDFFNIVDHRSNKPTNALWRSPEEDRVLTGASDPKQRKLKQKSPLIKELLIGEHDFRMLSIGYVDIQHKSERIDYLEKLFAAPFEELYSFGITIGLVGIPREEYDSMMFPKTRTRDNFDKVLVEPIDLKFPAFEKINDVNLPKQFPKERCAFTESENTRNARRNQCKVWKRHITSHKSTSIFSLRS